MNKMKKIITLSMVLCLVCPSGKTSVKNFKTYNHPASSTKIVTFETIEIRKLDTQVLNCQPISPEPTIETAKQISDSDVELIALITVAEAEGECEEGKRLVIDTILNRVDSTHFPDTIHDVIYQPSQFTSLWNGRVNRCTITDDIRQLVKEEYAHRTNSDVIFFTADRYSLYGRPLFRVGHHCFSTY